MSTKAKTTKAKKPEEWVAIGKGIYKPSQVTQPSLAAGIYEIKYNDSIGLMFVKKIIKTDNIVEFPDMVQGDIVNSIERFWAQKEVFKKYGQLHKRGILLFGSPGCGKTVTINLLSNLLVEAGGLVLYCNNPFLASEGISTLRKIEPDRPVIYVLEDMDVSIQQYGEQPLLALLDGENKVENIVVISTTNYPELLSERLIDRPSRFDLIAEVEMPSAQARGIYLRAVLDENDLSEEELQKWVSDSEGFSIAHLRELFVAVKCLDQEYQATVERLKGMAIAPKSKKRKAISVGGFGMIKNKSTTKNEFSPDFANVIHRDVKQT